MELAKLRFYYLCQEGEEFPCSCLWDFITLKQVVNSNPYFKAVIAAIRVESQRSQRRAALASYLKRTIRVQKEGVSDE